VLQEIQQKLTKLFADLNNGPFNDDIKRFLMENSTLTDVSCSEEYVLEADGKIKLEHADFTQALKACFELKQKFPHSHLKVYDANEKAHAPTDEQ
jgi:hypothetical protein